MTAPDSPLMTAAEFAERLEFFRCNAIGSFTAYASEDQEALNAAYRRAISEVERLTGHADTLAEMVAETVNAHAADAKKWGPELDRLRSEVERVTKDAERLDWLQEQVRSPNPDKDSAYQTCIGEVVLSGSFTDVSVEVGNAIYKGEGPTLREAIDRARGAVRGDARKEGQSRLVVKDGEIVTQRKDGAEEYHCNCAWFAAEADRHFQEVQRLRAAILGVVDALQAEQSLRVDYEKLPAIIALRNAVRGDAAIPKDAPTKCPNPYCENGLIRGSNGAVGCAVCNAPIPVGPPTFQITTAGDDDPWFYCIKCGAGWDAPFDGSGCPSCWLYTYLKNPEIGAAVRTALKKFCGLCGGPWGEHPRKDCSNQREVGV